MVCRTIIYDKDKIVYTDNDKESVGDIDLSYNLLLRQEFEYLW